MKNSTAHFSTKNLSKTIQKNFQLVLVGAIAVVVLLGTFIATQLSQQNQDNRNQASVTGGDVVIKGRQNPEPFYANGSQGEVILSANTNGVSITAIELYFKISGSTGGPGSPVQSVTVEATDPNRRQIFGANRITDENGNVTALSYTPNSDGTTDVSFAWLINGPGSTFSSTTDVDFAKVKFNVSGLNGPEAINLTFNDDSRASLPLEDDQEEPTDVLAHVPVMTFTSVLDNTNPTVAIDPTVTQCAQPTPPLCPNNDYTCVNTPNSAVCQQCTCDDETDPTDTPSPTATPTTAAGQNTPTSTPTPTPDGTGGVTYKYCGESCSAHTDCGVNLMCYTGVCRLANNPTDRYCNSPADNGIHRVCNEYCADSRECNTGLTCYYNRCRNPRNVSDQYCSEPVTYVAPKQTIVNRTVTRTVVITATPTEVLPTSAPLGGDNTSDVTPEWAMPTDTPWPTLPLISVSPEPEADEEVTLVTRIQNWLKGLLIVALVLGGVVFLLWLLPLLLNKNKDDDQTPHDELPPSRMNGPENN